MQSEALFHTMNVNVAATTASVTHACAVRADIAPSISAPLELFPFTEAPFAFALSLATAGEPGVVELVTLVVGMTFGVVAVVEDVTEVVALVVEVPFTLDLPVRYGGAGTAVDGSSSAPVPQAIGEPSGCALFGAGTVVPSGEESVKRVVQVRLGELGEEN